LLRNWRLVREVRGENHLTIAGLLFLARDPQDLLPHAYMSALRIPGTEIANEPIDQKRLEGRLTDMLRDAMRFVDLHLLRRHRIQGLEPEVRAEMPAEILREALVNACAHRDYTLAAPVRVVVFDDRVEVRTPGQLPNSVTLEALRFGVHVLRNPTIYNLLLKVGLVTDAGSGIPRMIRLLREAIGREPEFSLRGNEFIVTLPRPQTSQVQV
jgi:ATP-dependent DNA helicase RecG